MARYINTEPIGPLTLVCIWKPHEEGWESLCEMYQPTDEQAGESIGLASNEEIVAAAEHGLLCPDCVNAAGWLTIPALMAALRTSSDHLPLIWSSTNADAHVEQLATALGVEEADS